MIKVVTFNVLAPCWADPNSYPPGSVPYLDRVYRRAKIISVLQNLAPTTHFFCLEESTEAEFQYFLEALPNFTGMQVNHDASYWSKYTTKNPEPNGVALFIRNELYTDLQFIGLIDTPDGNHGAYIEAIHIQSGKRVGVACVHLDSDVGEHRNKEFRSLMNFLSDRGVDVTLIGADLNYTTTSGSIQKMMEEYGFEDVLQSVGNTEWTCSDIAGYAHAPLYGIIDHILVKGATPFDGEVLDNDLWNLYPDDSNTRVIINLLLVGSDHFPVWGQVSL